MGESRSSRAAQELSARGPSMKREKELIKTLKWVKEKLSHSMDYGTVQALRGAIAKVLNKVQKEVA